MRENLPSGEVETEGLTEGDGEEAAAGLHLDAGVGGEGQQS